MVGMAFGFFAAIFCFIGMECTYIGGSERAKDKLVLVGAIFHFVGGKQNHEILKSAFFPSLPIAADPSDVSLHSLRDFRHCWVLLIHQQSRQNCFRSLCGEGRIKVRKYWGFHIGTCFESTVEQRQFLLQCPNLLMPLTFVYQLIGFGMLLWKWCHSPVFIVCRYGIGTPIFLGFVSCFLIILGAILYAVTVYQVLFPKRYFTLFILP